MIRTLAGWLGAGITLLPFAVGGVSAAADIETWVHPIVAQRGWTRAITVQPPLVQSGHSE